MTNKQIVRLALARIKNTNGGVTVDALREQINAGGSTNVLTVDQIRRAMKDMPHAIKIIRDVWRIKGRATP